MNIAELIEDAYREGWKDGAATGESDSPDWNASEDWADSEARKRLKAPQQGVEYDVVEITEDELCGKLR